MKHGNSCTFPSTARERATYRQRARILDVQPLKVAIVVVLLVHIIVFGHVEQEQHLLRVQRASLLQLAHPIGSVAGAASKGLVAGSCVSGCLCGTAGLGGGKAA